MCNCLSSCVSLPAFFFSAHKEKGRHTFLQNFQPHKLKDTVKPSLNVSSFLGEEAHQWLCDHLGHPSLLRCGCLSWCGDSKALSAKWIQGRHLPEVCQCTRKSSFHRDVLKSLTELSFSGALSSDYIYNEWCFGKKACVILPNPSIMLFFVAHPGGHRAWL